jgi:hypothetical protein
VQWELHYNFHAKSANEKSLLNGSTYETFVAFVMVVGADPVIFGAMIDLLETSSSVGSDNYPQTINNTKNFLDSIVDIA